MFDYKFEMINLLEIKENILVVVLVNEYDNFFFFFNSL